jgi:hypothetical protein
MLNKYRRSSPKRQSCLKKNFQEMKLCGEEVGKNSLKRIREERFDAEEKGKVDWVQGANAGLRCPRSKE